MTTVVSDNVEVELDMKYTGWEVIELEAITSRYNETDLIKATVIDPNFEKVPQSGSYATLDINGRRVFTGEVREVSESEKNTTEKSGKFEVKLMNDLHKAKNTKISIDVEEPTPLSEVVQQVCVEAGLFCEIDLTWRPSDVSQTASDWLIAPKFNEKNAAEVLDKLALWANADWFFNNFNILEFGLPDAEVKIVEYVKSESNFGPIQPPYRGVKVIVSGAVSESSNQKAHRIPGYELEPIKRALIFSEEEGWKIKGQQTNEPVFVFKDEQVQKYKTAEAIGEKLARDLLRQVKGGKIVIVGDETIDERDVIQLPDFLGSRRYFIGEIKHKINDSDGFITELQLESAVPGDGV
jgi:hypothetical protein